MSAGERRVRIGLVLCVVVRIVFGFEVALRIAILWIGRRLSIEECWKKAVDCCNL